MLAALALLATLQSPDVTFAGYGGLELKGTLQLPVDATKAVPAVLLLPGSGPTDRDGNQLPGIRTDLLKQIAEKLADAGIATLRFDKRAVASVYLSKYPKEVAGLNDFFSWEAHVADAQAGMAYLRSNKAIDPRRIGILGHSEGSIISLCVATESKPGEVPAAVALLGAPGRRLDVIMREQVAASLDRSKVDAATKQTYLDWMDLAVNEVVEKGTVPAGAPQGMGALFPSYATKLLKSYFTLDPCQLAAKVSSPVLVVQGENDIQISVDRDTSKLVDALKSRAGKSTSVTIVKGASHNLKAVKDPLTDPGFSGPVVQDGLDSITKFFASNLK